MVGKEFYLRNIVLCLNEKAFSIFSMIQKDGIFVQKVQYEKVERGKILRGYYWKLILFSKDKDKLLVGVIILSKLNDIESSVPGRKVKIVFA